MTLPAVSPVDLSGAEALRAQLDAKAKPLGALGRIEDLAVRLGLIAGGSPPSFDRALLLVFAGDHGMNAEGVSAYPSAVTQAMVATFLAGKASANAFARAVGAELRVVDAGVDAELPSHSVLIDAKVRRGSRNAAVEPALTQAEVESALERGAGIALQAAEEGFEILALGEMGIGNTASAALLMHRLAPAPLAGCIGRGAGHDEAGLARKIAILERAAARSAATEPLEVLAEFGGLEIAMMAGAIIGAASAKIPVLVDGFIVSAAALVAIRLVPAAKDYCVFCHRSAEQGHGRLLAALEVEPLLALDLRLGEGTGALLALPMVRAASRLLSDVASLDDVLNGRL
ncbi:nicotinate-nucleotide--dimethylbenzimidazole phosphoribosyltransferase [Caulobacter segnis]|uniref:Nicotinate-nucleotide--dimethylbenzimidazole phosphoribosyltransferase n=2 Tax=Caulobacter segnis TaxID=88688 RepID=D5VGM7_CAUST|nr:nicotinate-nucleotide--dimethylbenzimidazole phosphoribosyltransferase [Caulobacter segnis]ADG10470.1 nicotinate-nucleotide/dimethylbenzimidazole phosphoribosyltransferase [Caulobacter segnis ATCC 21756]AVQ02198.1 nicotinate-nucleotide--dimethylbenzimidazole phosphoribosyltransferase [Caulobacter segnis]